MVMVPQVELLRMGTVEGITTLSFIGDVHGRVSQESLSISQSQSRLQVDATSNNNSSASLLEPPPLPPLPSSSYPRSRSSRGSLPAALPQNGYLVHVHPSHPSQISPQFVAFDISHYLMQRIRPLSINDPAGDTIFDSTLSTVPRSPWAAFCTACEAMMVYTMMTCFTSSDIAHRPHPSPTTSLAMATAL
ncbi:hypothetical protein BGY98DRAFT_687838 [Russula aff. rugulosa BPL654]|nr:hypothetical protein BGY98DRAFT_687838 [Russula aff. rugulosa BPL654]